MQKTLKQNISISGIGLHSGQESELILMPAKENSGIVFVRSDLNEDNIFPALYNFVIDTRNCTCLGNKKGGIVSTIEHIMSALYIAGVDNACIKINNPEVPIMDGSAAIFYEKLKKAELQELSAHRKYLKVKRNIKFTDDNGNYVELKPANQLKIKFVIDFPSKIVGHQEFDSSLTDDIYEKIIAPARTFCEKYQVDYLRSIGLIKGGSLENAVVLDGENVLNDGGFRVKNECVNHKVLDCIGDMYTSGYRLLAEIEAFHSGHFHNNEVLKLLFADSANYEIIEE